MTRKKFPITVMETAMLRYMRDNKTTYVEHKEVNDKKVPVIKYNIFKNFDIVHGFSTRIGGVSKEHLSAMNLSFTRGDKVENVLENHRIFAEAVGYDMSKLVCSDQVHATNIYKVTSKDVGKGITRESDIKNIDGLVTNEKNIPLITLYADCVPLYFYDPVRLVVGVAHSGWKGTVNNIGKCMIEFMTNEYGSSPENIICAIGPSICKNCYEISQDVADEFKGKYSDSYILNILHNKGDGKYLLDLHYACKVNLILAGVKEENIAMPDLCTCCNSNLLFSHRASKGMRGNLAAVIMLK